MSCDRTNEDYEDRVASDAACGFHHPPGPTSNEVLQLQQRLIGRTEQSLLTARRDAERIRVLEEENRKLREQVRILNKELSKG